MSHILLQQSLRRQRCHPSAFFVLGDPSPPQSIELAAAAVREGCSMLELGFPYGDPCADGPAIQAANVRALAAGTSTKRAFALLDELRARCPDTPLNLLVYGNLVHRRGLAAFAADAVAAGASSLLVPDMPLEESGPLRRACAIAGLGHCELVGPRTAPARLAALDRASDAFLYLVAHQGITGVRRDGATFDDDLVARVAEATSNPLCVGFGLSSAAHLRAAFASGARIAVVGSALAEVIASSGADVVERLAAAVRALLAPAPVPPSALPRG